MYEEASSTSSAERRQFLRDFLARHSLITGGEVKLSAGGTSSFYFDCKKATLNGGFLCRFADWILDSVVYSPPLLSNAFPRPDAVGGPTLGADFIAAAVAMRAHQRRIPLVNGCIVRKQVKRHGTQNTIENAPRPGARVLVVEDVITSGNSVAHACDAFLAAGYHIAAIAVIIDREAGGRQALESTYKAPVYSLFNRADFSKDVIEKLLLPNRADSPKESIERLLPRWLPLPGRADSSNESIEKITDTIAAPA